MREICLKTLEDGWGAEEMTEWRKEASQMEFLGMGWKEGQIEHRILKKKRAKRESWSIERDHFYLLKIREEGWRVKEKFEEKVVKLCGENLHDQSGIGR